MISVNYFFSLGCLALTLTSLGHAVETPASQSQPIGEQSKAMLPLPPEDVKKNSVFTQEQRKELENHFEAYIKSNPHVVKQALEKLITAEAAEQERKDKEMAETLIKTHGAAIFKNEALPMMGNQVGEKVFAVFVDPYCGYCQESLKDLKAFVKTDGRVKVVVHDVAILGESSEIAVKALLAAKLLGKYVEFQEAMKQAKAPLDLPGLKKIAKTLGIDEKAFAEALEKKEVKDLYNANMRLVDALKLDATPTLVHGLEMIRGYMPLERLKQRLGFPAAEKGAEKSNEKGQPS
ncbi:MAG: DsbA family protein [Alphaproteobacteria bacterium]